jgi:hypothetical protein
MVHTRSLDQASGMERFNGDRASSTIFKRQVEEKKIALIASQSEEPVPEGG